MAASRSDKKDRECNACNRKFKPERSWQKFCSGKCRDAYHTGRKREANKLLAGQQYERICGKEDDKDLQEMWNDFCLFIKTHKSVLLRLLPKE